MTARVTVHCVQQHLDKLIQYLNPYSSLANTAMINFIVDDLWTKEVPKSIQHEINSEEAAHEAVNIFWQIHNESSTATVADDKYHNYRLYLEKSRAHHLDAMPNLWITPEVLKQQLSSDSLDNGLTVKGHMSDKKMHEVSER